MNRSEARCMALTFLAVCICVAVINLGRSAVAQDTAREKPAKAGETCCEHITAKSIKVGGFHVEHRTAFGGDMTNLSFQGGKKGCVIGIHGGPDRDPVMMLYTPGQDVPALCLGFDDKGQPLVQIHPPGESAKPVHLTMADLMKLARKPTK